MNYSICIVSDDMNIVTVINEFIKKYRQDNNLSFHKYYNDLAQKIDIIFNEESREWDAIFQNNQFSKTPHFKDVKTEQIREIFDVLIDNHSNEDEDGNENDTEYFQTFFETYFDEITNHQLLLIYDKYFDLWYKCGDNCNTYIMLATLDRIVNMYKSTQKPT